MRMDRSTCTPGYLLCCLLPAVFACCLLCYLLPAATCSLLLPAQNHISTGSVLRKEEGRTWRGVWSALREGSR